MPKLDNRPYLILVLTLVSISPIQAQVHSRWSITDPNGFSYQSLADLGEVSRSAPAGDCNGDGIEDIICGTPFDFSSGPQAGLIHVVSGADGSILFTNYGYSSSGYYGVQSTRLGMQVGGMGDLDGDGHADVFAFADGRYSTDCGPYPYFPFCVYPTPKVIFWSGATGQYLGQITGVSFVRPAGDTNGDGIEDLVLFHPNFPQQRIEHVGSNDPPVPLPIQASAAGPVGDLNGDGHPDVILGGPNYVSSSTWVTQNSYGRATVCSGLDGSILMEFWGTNSNDGLGRAVAGLGDMNGDGVPDFAYSTRVSIAGSAEVLVRSGSDGALIHSIPAPPGVAFFGGSITGGRDLNGDGHPDFIVSSNIGLCAYSGIDASLVAILPYVGASMIGDLDGDGFAEFTVSNAMGQVDLVAMGGIRTYGTAHAATNILDLAWLPSPASQATAGTLMVSGASPFSSGALVVAIHESDVDQFGIRLLVGWTAGEFQIGFFNYDAAGTFALPGLQLHLPALAWVTANMQAFEQVSSSPLSLNASLGLTIEPCIF